jgi:hypothetical protein
MLAQATTPAKNWVWIENAWVLAIEGQGQIGYAWDGTYLVTNEPQPTQPMPIEGAQTL